MLKAPNCLGGCLRIAKCSGANVEKIALLWDRQALAVWHIWWGEKKAINQYHRSANLYSDKMKNEWTFPFFFPANYISSAQRRYVYVCNRSDNTTVRPAQKDHMRKREGENDGQASERERRRERGEREEEERERERWISFFSTGLVWPSRRCLMWASSFHDGTLLCH